MVGEKMQFESAAAEHRSEEVRAGGSKRKQRDADEEHLPEPHIDTRATPREPPLPFNAPPRECQYLDAPVPFPPLSTQCPRDATCIRPARHPGFCKRIPAPATVTKGVVRGARVKVSEALCSKPGNAPITPPEQAPGAPVGQAVYGTVPPYALAKLQHSSQYSAATPASTTAMANAKKHSRMARMAAGIKNRTSMMPPTSFEESPSSGTAPAGGMRRVQSAVFATHSTMAGVGMRKPASAHSSGMRRSASQIFGDPVCYKCGGIASEDVDMWRCAVCARHFHLPCCSIAAPSPGSFGRIVLSCDKCQWVGAGIQLSSKSVVSIAQDGSSSKGGEASSLNMNTRRRCFTNHSLLARPLGGQGIGVESKLGIACVTSCKACVARSSDIEAHIYEGGCLEEVKVV